MKHSLFVRTYLQASSRSRPFRRLSVILGVGLAVLLQASVAKGVIANTSQMIGFSSGNLGVVGVGEGWAGSSGSYTVTSGSGSLDGTGLGLVASAGDKATVSTAAGSLNTHNTFTPVNGYFSGNTNVYYSFLIRFTNAADVDVAGEQIAQINRRGSGSGVHFLLFARNSGGAIQIGANKPGGTAVYATTNLTAAQTAFVVVRQQMSSAAANDDIIDIWINPDPLVFGLDEGSIPSPGVSTSNGNEDTSGTGPGRFYLYSGTGYDFDELRVASTWAEVTPSPLQCTAAAVTTDPTNATVVAGINAFFQVAADGTSPSYLWQVSSNSGANWSNIPGAANATYATPNLTLADDGKQYRCIVSVSCDSSSATSAVATVTVQAPVVTPPGLIMDDDWSDLDRTTGPITVNNSIWYASSASSLTFNYVPNSLFGVSASGTSRLWVGYFTDDTITNLPVHLAVGTTIKATWEWNSDLIGTSGGGLRLGLFDYADGGTRVPADNFGSGSGGNGNNVRGYMLVVDQATTFPDATPFELRARTVLADDNLMGSTGNYPVTLASGPAGLNGAPAFQNLTNYTLELTVTRTGANAVQIQANISGGGTNWSLSATDNTYAYHRFDAFAIRPGSLESTAADFEFVNFKVEVLQAAPTPEPLVITSSGGDVTLSWTNPQFQLQAAGQASGTYTNVPGAMSPYPVSVSGAQRFFRLVYP
jgi:hypothetical protein